MSPFFTRSGDDGTTGLLGDQRVEKSDLQIEVLGTLDELSAALGLARSLASQSINHDLRGIQTRIYEMLSELAATKETANRFMKIDEKTVLSLEKSIEKYSLQTPPPDEFILPGDTTASAAISLARTIARRAERRLVAYRKQKHEIRLILLQYLNRLSSFLYILEIHTIHGQSDGTPSLANKKEQ